MAVKTPERGSFEAKPAGGCPGVCGGCPGARSCGALTVKGESGSGKVLVYESVEKLLQEPKLPSGTIYFGSGPARQSRGEPPINKFVSNEIKTSSETCSKCNKPASTCPHSAARTH